MSKTYEMNMTEGKIFSKLVVFTIPILLSGMLQLLYNAADIAVVGRFAGKEALAAVGAAGPITNLLLNFFMGLATGSNIVLATAYGEGNKQKIKDTVHTASLLSIICGIFVGVLGFIISKPMLVLMNTPEDALELCNLYVKIIFLGMPALLVYNFGAAMLRAIGDTKRPLYMLVFTGLINVILNLILVIVFKMSVAGVAIATIVSQYVSAFLIIRCFVKTNESYKLNLKELKLNKAITKRILILGIPGGIQGLVFSLSNSIVQSAINGFGSVVVAGNAVSLNIEGFLYNAENSVAQAALSFVGQNYGARKIHRIKKTFLSAGLLVIIVGATLSAFALKFATPLCQIYSTSQEVISYAVLRLGVLCPVYFICGIMDVMTNTLRGMGRSINSMISCILGVCGIRLVWIFVVFERIKTLQSLYSCYTASWIGTCIVLTTTLIVVIKKENEMIKGE